MGSMQAAEASTGFSGNNAFIFPPIESSGSGLPPPAKPHKSRSNKNAAQQQDNTGGNVGMAPPAPLGASSSAAHGGGLSLGNASNNANASGLGSNLGGLGGIGTGLGSLNVGLGGGGLGGNNAFSAGGSGLGRINLGNTGMALTGGRLGGGNSFMSGAGLGSAAGLGGA